MSAAFRLEPFDKLRGAPVEDPTADFDRTTSPKLIVTDLDGTFLSPDGSVSEQNAAAVAAAQAAGIPVLFATGRPVRWLDVIRDLPGAHPTVIASNGAALYDLGAGELVDRICIDPEIALAAVRRVREVVPDASFAFESGTRFGYEPAYRTWPVDDGTDPALYRGPAEEVAISEEFVKMLVQSQSVRPDDLLDIVRVEVGKTLTATHSQTRDFGLVEISAAGVTKASMLRRFCARLGIDGRQVAAFGDMPNDVDMLSSVGMPHVVANAHPALRALNFPVVPSNVDSGVGRTIMGLLSPVPT
ncbi:MAG TPA: HAD family hydrolase [Propionibacteriaceae bacterium]|nr:HAD family hydrolase [Propionibacteriaceae bacterium]